MSLSAKVICFVACHGGPADHFSVFSEKLIQEGCTVQVYAADSMVKKFQDRNIPATSFHLEGITSVEEEVLAKKIAESCKKAFVLLTDVGHSFDERLQKALQEKAPEVLRLSYYDNSEPEVPGGYSEIAAKVMKASQGVLFANAHLATSPLYQGKGKQIELPLEKRVGVGYYPIAQAEKIAKRRQKEKASLKSQFFKKQGIVEKDQKVFVYFGGNNEEYFKSAFPSFLNFLSQSMKKEDLSNQVMVLQQHPGAKILGRDRKLLELWLNTHEKDGKAPRIVLSQDSTEDMQVLADAALYYQTSMGPIFALAGIPIIQVAHETYLDVLVRGKLCPSVTNASEFFKAISEISPQKLSKEKEQVILQSLGLQENWFSVLQTNLTIRS
jgi:hypothetical protein